MDKLIFQFFKGDLGEGYSRCRETVKQYSKNKCDYIISGETKINGPQIHFEKLQFMEYFDYYDRILYLDSDILITPKARDIFNLYPDTDRLYAFDENSGEGWMDRDPFVTEIEPKIDWPKNSKGNYRYFNTGVLLMGKKSIGLYNPFASIFECSSPRLSSFAEQTCFNYGIAKSGIGTGTIDYCFNRMDLGNYDIINDRFNADFIHYAGPCKYGFGSKSEMMCADYSKMYKT